MLDIAKRLILIAFAAGITQTEAQAGLPRIGWLSNGAEGGYENQALEQGLGELGLVDGRTVQIVRRSGRGDPKRLGRLAEELVKLRVSLILAPDPPSAAAARKATKSIPIVVRVSNDPVKSGLAEALSHPGGNVTGVYSNSDELVGKRLEILKEAFPKLKRVAVLWDSDFESSKLWFAEAQKAARAMSVLVVSVEVHGSKPDFRGAIAAAVTGKAQALIALRNPQIVAALEEIAALLAARRVPAIFDEQRFVQAGGLMSYGADLRELHRHLASYVDRILKGARPESLPVEQPTRFELVINMKTAGSLGVKMPQTLLQRADRVIE